MTESERCDVLRRRRLARAPWHSPPHWDLQGQRQYLVSAACFEHAAVVGKHGDRIRACEEQVVGIARSHSVQVYAWSVLPTHYHVLLETEQIKELRRELGRFHGRSSHDWNVEDGCRGRQVWHNCFERPMKSERHFWVTLNYVHHNPVHHGYAQRWQDWPFSSAAAFLEAVGREEAERIWRAYPVLDYGKDWDIG